MATKRANRDSGRRPAGSLSGDSKLLRRVAEVVLVHPKKNAGEALESLGVDDLATHRRIRRAFEAKREKLLTAARSSAGQIGKQGRVVRSAAVVTPGNPPISSPDLGTISKSAKIAAERLGRSLMDLPSASANIEDHRAKTTSAVANAAQESSGSAMGWLKTGFETYASAVRAQSALVRAWTWFPPVVFSLQQQAMTYSMGLGRATRG